MKTYVTIVPYVVQKKASDAICHTPTAGAFIFIFFLPAFCAGVRENTALVLAVMPASRLKCGMVEVIIFGVLKGEDSGLNV